LLSKLRHLYEGRAADSARFRYCLLVFDLVTITFIIATSFIPRNNVVEWFDTIFGIVILADFSARIAISRHRLREFLHPSTWADIAAIISFLAPLVGEAAGFLRVLRTVRLLRSYQLLLRLRADFDYFRAHEEVILAATNLTVFVFVMTGFVYETEHGSNPLITNYADALYFTVTALTTTGFGDITLPWHRWSVGFAVVRPGKVRYRCAKCGLLRHDFDAVHCKACGAILSLPDILPISTSVTADICAAKSHVRFAP
jgi:voltage-gated potassium channel